MRLLALTLCACVSVLFALPITLRTEGEFDFTILHITDVHGHVLANRHVNDSADFGDLVSLLAHMGAAAKNANKNLMFFDSGDLIEGTGLSDATDVHGEYIFEVAEHVPYDGLTMGNHDIGHSTTTELMMKGGGFIESWHGRYVAANSLFKPANDTTMGSPYRVVTTSGGAKVLVLGFMYDFDHNADNTVVEHVAAALTHPFFKEAMDLASDCDLVVVTAHIDVNQAEYMEIYSAVRNAHADIPLVMLAGHAHMKKYKQFDDNAIAIESGKYFEVLGHLTFHTSRTGAKRLTVEHEWVPCTKTQFVSMAGVPASEFETAEGLQVREQMMGYFDKLGLNELEGCAPATYSKTSYLTSNDSFYALYINHVVPEFVMTAKTQNTPFFICNTATLRSNLYEGEVLFDDVFTIAPFKDDYYVILGVDGEHLQLLLDELAKSPWSAARVAKRYLGVLDAEPNSLPHFVTSNITVDKTVKYDLLSADYDSDTMEAVLHKLFPEVYAKERYPTDYTSTTALRAYIQQHFPCKEE